MARSISNDDDFFDSRDVAERLAELEADNETEPFEEGSDEWNEYASLKNLADQGADLSDWEFGNTLIRDSYFETYAEELASDIGAIDPEARWPLNHIDWEAAADELQQDYTSVEFDGVTYWAH